MGRWSMRRVPCPAPVYLPTHAKIPAKWLMVMRNHAYETVGEGVR